MSDGYSRVYRIGLLDDLHNYFPELLYNVESFNTVQDVLMYVRDRTAQRFNIFDNAARSYRTSRLDSSLRAASTQEIPPLQFNRPRNVVRVYEPPGNHLSALLSDLLTMEHAAPRPIPQRIVTTQNILNSLYEDVVVHATQQIIDRSSSLRTLTADLEENCSICQDLMKTGESLRKLTGCNHEFHTACIDPWLLTRSVLCPSCRHDIRLEGLSTVVPSPITAPLPSSLPTENQDDETIAAQEFISMLFPGRRF